MDGQSVSPPTFGKRKCGPCCLLSFGLMTSTSSNQLTTPLDSAATDFVVPAYVPIDCENKEHGSLEITKLQFELWRSSGSSSQIRDEWATHNPNCHHIALHMSRTSSSNEEGDLVAQQLTGHAM